MTTPTREETSRPALLLVHGAWFGPWSWEKVRPELTARGWEVHTVDLPSVADRGGPRFSLHDDAAVVKERIEAISRRVVVVAHSYGGAVALQGAANLANVRQHRVRLRLSPRRWGILDSARWQVSVVEH